MADYADIGIKAVKELRKIADEDLFVKWFTAQKKDYKDTLGLSAAIGRRCEMIFKKIDFSQVPTEDLQLVASQVINQVYAEGQRIINRVAKALIQQGLVDAGTSFKPLEVPTDNSRLEAIEQRYADATEHKEVAFLEGSGVATNIARAQLIDSVKANFEYQSDLGLNTRIIRHLGNDGCCKWCQSMAGEYEYGQEPEDFWRIHKDCDCWIELKTGKASQRIRHSTVNGRRIKITT